MTLPPVQLVMFSYYVRPEDTSCLWRYTGVPALSTDVASPMAAVVYSCAGSVWLWHREDAAGTGKEIARCIEADSD